MQSEQVSKERYSLSYCLVIKQRTVCIINVWGYTEILPSHLIYLPFSFPGGLLGSMFAGYVPLASQSLYPIIVYSVANYRPHLSHFWANMSFSRSQLSHFIFMYVPYME